MIRKLPITVVLGISFLNIALTLLEDKLLLVPLAFNISISTLSWGATILLLIIILLTEGRAVRSNAHPRLPNDKKRPARRPAETSSFEVIAGISHDLRTPLTSIRGYAESILLRGESISASQRNELLDGIIRNADTMTKMLEASIGLSKIEGDLLELSPMKVAPLFQAIRERYKNISQEGGIKLQIEDVSNDLTVLGAPMLIERVLGNLIDNSLRFTPKTGSISVSTRIIDNQTVLISVRDTGCGIPQHELANVTRKHYRVERDRSRNTGGAGLGLSIVQSILKKHSSTLELTSTEGRGTTASFALKRA